MSQPRTRARRDEKLGKVLHRKVCGRHVAVAIRNGWEVRNLNSTELADSDRAPSDATDSPSDDRLRPEAP